MKILVGVCSCHRYWAKRAAVRETWMTRLPDRVAAMFFVGNGGEITEPDVATLSARDDYEGLPGKISAFFQYALTHYDFDYLFKCDDDTYLLAEGLLTLLEGNPDFVGSARWWPRCAGGGAGYLLSKTAVRIVAQAPFPETGPEDVWVTQTLKDQGIKFLATPRLLGCCQEFPQTHGLITASECHPEILREIHRRILKINDNPVVISFAARHTRWQGTLNCYQNGIFTGGRKKPHGRWELQNNGDILLLKWFDWPHDRLCKNERGYANDKLKLELEKIA